LFIGLRMQADLLEALLRDGSLSIDAARPLVAAVEGAAAAWRKFFEEGEDLMAEPLQRLRGLIGPPPR
jgi:hypothetical protein